jgi:hypothetical protein
VPSSPPAVAVLAALLLSAAACQSSSPASPDAAAADARTDVDAAPDADLTQLPDLTVNLDRARVDLAIRRRTFAADACELDPAEDCIAEPGERRLLHFSVETPNIGTADLELGAPTQGNDQFAYSDCHGHYHFEGYAEYRLIDAASATVATGRKQAFCLLDSEKYVDGDDSVSDAPRYSCDFQGIQRGWSDVYHSRLPCQFIDVTDVADGDYQLEIRINNGGVLPELTLANNIVSLPVTLGADELERPTEACPDDAAAHATETPNRECGWDLAGEHECTAGQKVHVGCSQGCDLGSCTGDPMLRVCDAARPDGNCSYPGAIAFDDDSCGSQCPTAAFVTCPDSGRLVVYTAPFSPGAAYTCEVALRVANN